VRLPWPSLGQHDPARDPGGLGAAARPAHLRQDRRVKTETARLLGIKTSALYYKLEKYGIGGAASKPREEPEDGNKGEG